MALRIVQANLSDLRSGLVTAPARRQGRGDELLVSAGDKSFWVRADGSFRRESKVRASAVKLFACDLTSVFGKSDYAHCSLFVDLESHKERTLGYQGVCT